MNNKYAVFDLDGTIIDSKNGIVSCFKETFADLNTSYPGDKEIIKTIGLSLRKAFSHLLSTDDIDAVENAVARYREHYINGGWNKYELYEGITHTIKKLNSQNIKLYIATAKSERFARKILDNSDLEHLFTDIAGPDNMGIPNTKKELIEVILNRNELNPKSGIMIGDRKEDILGGRGCGLQTIGVSYGYGTLEEINNANPNHITHHAYDVADGVNLLHKIVANQQN